MPVTGSQATYFSSPPSVLCAALWVVTLFCPPWAWAERPPPGLVIEGVDFDRPYPGKLRIPSDFGVLVWAPSISATLKGPNSAKIESASGLGGGIHGRFGKWTGEVVGLSLDTVLENPFLVEGFLFQRDSQFQQTSIFLRVAREFLRWRNEFGQFSLSGGLRVARIERSFGTLTPLLADPTIPSLELTMGSRHNVGGHFGVHTRTTYARGSGDQASEEAFESRTVLNYHIRGEEPNTLDLSFGLRYLKERIRFRSDVGFPSTQGTYTYLGPEVSLSLRF